MEQIDSDLQNVTLEIGLSREQKQWLMYSKGNELMGSPEKKSKILRLGVLLVKWNDTRFPKTII